jgi:hypothetical protein
VPNRPDRADASPRTSPRRDASTAARPSTRQQARRWLLFVHQLPSSPSNLRVKTWRRMQQLGAIAIRQAVYVLPDGPNAREDFEWLKAEVEGAGGDVTVFVASTADTWSDDQLVEEFRQSRQDAFAALADEIEALLASAAKRGRRPARTTASARLIDGLRQRFAAIEAVDFFGSAGRDRVVTLLQQLASQPAGRATAAATESAQGRPPIEAYQRRLWITRPRPGVDRMSSAWLIQRCIDPKARFGFAADRDSVPRDGVPFDMFGVEFSHHGEHCTFETLCRVFGIDDPAVARIATIVHDLDLKDGRFNPPEAASVGALIDGMQMTHADDDALLAQGMAMFEALYRSFGQSARRSGPRPVASRRTGKRPPSRKPRSG